MTSKYDSLRKVSGILGAFVAAMVVCVAPAHAQCANCGMGSSLIDGNSGTYVVPQGHKGRPYVAEQASGGRVIVRPATPMDIAENARADVEGERDGIAGNDPSRDDGPGTFLSVYGPSGAEQEMARTNRAMQLNRAWSR